MKLIDALEIARRPAAESSRPLRVFLACGFTPLHLQSFFAAHLRSRMPGTQPEISCGLYGDLVGSLERLNSAEVDVLVVVIEWTDLDPRLGVRQLGGWRPADIADIAKSATDIAGRLQRAIEVASQEIPTVVSLPTLPLPPAFTTRPLQCGLPEAQLNRIPALMAESFSGVPGLRLLSPQTVALASAPAGRYDIKSDLLTGFPYTVNHASAMGDLLTTLVENRPPMKGLITDLDDTLWSGIVGDDGTEGISWNLDAHSQMHGIYQQFLSSMAAAGVLLGVASKNDTDMVMRAFDRRDLLLSKDDVFPFEVHWSSKSESVRRILDTWNVAAESVVFVDDNPGEIAQIQAAFPDMTCLLFPKNDPAAIWALLEKLRDLFGKAAISEEDSLRLRSIRNSGAWRNENSTHDTPSDDFLRSVQARISFECSRAIGDTRALELVNKTNQFNLNGSRYTESEWRQFLGKPSAFLLTAAYEDKFGSLGKIAVLLGTAEAGGIHLQSWVMSCRAFSRRIEHQCLRYLFDELRADHVSFENAPTPRNGPMQDFLKSLAGSSLDTPVVLTREKFFAMLPPLFHRVEVSAHV